MSGRPATDQVYKAFHGLGEGEWLDVMRRSLEENVINDVTMPTFPDERTQSLMHGHASRLAIQGAFAFYSEVRAYAQVSGRPLEPHRRLLDFGCGWGRMLRMFMKDIQPRNLIGAEPHSEFVMLARQHNPYVTFLQSEYLPPLPLAEDSLDYIIAFSVFSHLDEYSANRWVDAFYKLLAPGGMLVFTTQGRRFLDQCADLRKRKAAGETFTQPWHDTLAIAFEDGAAANAQFDRGEFLFAGMAGRLPSPSARYSEAIIPPRYVEAHWGSRFHVVDYVDDPKRLAQALIVLQKPS